MSGRAPRSAAAVVLFRVRAGGPEVFLVKRSDRVRFMGGFHAFPGGGAERADASIEVAGVPAGEPAVAVVAAIRECFEETGVLFFSGRLRDPDSLRMWRRRLLADSDGASIRGMAARGATFEEVLEKTGVTPDASGFKPVGHWITPPFSPIRFDTRFYLAEAPEGQKAEVLPGELAEGGWIEPAAALAGWERGETLMAPPIVHLLRAAASSKDPGDWPAAATSAPEAKGGEVRRIEMRRGIILIPLRTPTLPPATHTNCYVVGGNRPVIVDPGANDPAEAGALDDLLADLSREGRRPSRIAITHHHYDHVGGVERLRKALEIPVLAHPDTREQLGGTVAVTEDAADGQALETGDDAAPVRVLHTPGHSRGHLAFVEEGTGSLLSGDLVLGLGTTIVDPPDGDMESYMRSLERLAGMELASLFPGHGPVLARAQDQIGMYRAHRDEREQQVLSALEKGPATPEEIVSSVYSDVPVELHPFAARSVIAHLEWLERRGAVARTAERWNRVD